MDRSDKRVLMLAAAFPPIGGPGVQRTLKFAKYLPKFGWRPIVWCLDEMKGLPIDTTLLDELPAEVRRLPAGELIQSNRRRRRLGSSMLSAWSGAGRRPARAIEGGEWIDEFAPIASECVEGLVELIEAQGVAAIYSTFSPPTNHWLGLVLKERTRRPWVADFRDLWIDDCRYDETSASIHERRCRLQRRILADADAVVGVSESQTRVLAGQAPAGSGKFHTITNGFDVADFAGLPRHARDESRFVIAHVGRLDRWRASEELLGGLQRFIRTHDGSTLIEVRLIGHANTAWVRKARAAGVRLTAVPYVSHHEAIEEMGGADVLLLPLPQGSRAETLIAAKLFEYLAVRQPVLVVGPGGGETERIVRDLAAGEAVTHDEFEVAAALGRLFGRWKAGERGTSLADVCLRPFSREELTGRLAELLDGLTAVNATFLRAASATARAPRADGGQRIRVAQV